MKIIGIGSEIVECLRVARMIERHGERFINRVFTKDEVAYCNRRQHATQHFAGRWAAKEAVLKALGIRSRKGFDFRDVEIRTEKGTGKPMAAFRGAARDTVRELAVGEIMLTISTSRAVATATAIALRRTIRRKKKKS